jgi:hypothetical protein
MPVSHHLVAKTAAPLKLAKKASQMQRDGVQRIKAKAREERKLLSKLERTLTSPDLKQLVKPALHALHNVECYFLDPKSKRPAAYKFGNGKVAGRSGKGASWRDANSPTSGESHQKTRP